MVLKMLMVTHNLKYNWCLKYTYWHNDENSSNAEAYGNTKANGQTAIKDSVENQIEVVNPSISHNAEQCDTAMNTNKESIVEYIELIKMSEDVLLDVRNGSEVAGEDGAGRDTDQDAAYG